MALIDDARRLAVKLDPWMARIDEDGYEYSVCHVCEADDSTGHDRDCPTLSLPRIVAALEASERYVRTGHPQDWFPAALALEMAEIRDTPRGRVFVATIDDPVPPA